jgi:hypothetical protein
MSACRFLFCVLCILFILCAGCTSLAVGNVAPVQDGLLVHVTNSGDPVEAGVQVRVYQIRDMEQRELTNTGIPVMLGRGENAVNVPVRLEPGTYKLYIYVTVNSERKTASIKDIVV